MEKKRIYTFGNGHAEGKADMRNLLGGKGANLAEMNLIGVPVPPGFTITTEVCNEYFEKGKDDVVALLKNDVEKSIAGVEELMKSKFGDVENPLLVSVRSGARASMPGMMDTILNLGLNDKVVVGLAKKTGNERFAWDSYRRFIQMYGDVVLGMKPTNKEDIDPFEAIIEDVKKAKEIAGGRGLVAVNIMVALKHYEDHVRTAVDAGVDVIISGAGLPMRLPEYVGDSGCKIAPIVSSVKAAQIILRQWKKKYCRTADFIVIEGPKAGGHLGFKKEDIATITAEKYEQEIKNIIQVVREYEQEFACEIPVIVAGGIFDHKDIEHALEIGADGVQIASRFVATEECDASDAYKQAYINAKAEDITIVMSPVGMPGRALNNAFVQRVSRQREEIKKCYNCLAKCNPVEVPYCITKALISAVQGDLDHGLIFVGANVDRIDRMTSVQELMAELTN